VNIGGVLPGGAGGLDAELVPPQHAGPVLHQPGHAQPVVDSISSVERKLELTPYYHPLAVLLIYSVEFGFDPEPNKVSSDQQHGFSGIYRYSIIYALIKYLRKKMNLMSVSHNPKA